MSQNLEGPRVRWGTNPDSNKSYWREETSQESAQRRQNEEQANRERQEGPPNFDPQTRNETSSLPRPDGDFEYDDNGNLVRRE